MGENVALSWNRAALEAVRQTRMGPPLVARALHALHAAMYDAWAAHDLAFGCRLGDELRRPPAERTGEAKREAVSFAAHLALTDLFPSETTAFAKLMSDLGYDPDAVGPEGSASAVGVAAARAVLALRHGDGANQLGDLGPGPRGPAAAYDDWTGYRPANSLQRLVDPNRWRPLPTPDGLGQRFLVPHWGLVAPFGLDAGWELRPRTGLRRHPGRGYLVQAEQLLADSAGLTDEHKAIAEYWVDGPGSETPPGHWCLHAQDVSARDGHGLDEDVRLFFALTGALLDAGIACWDAKRAYDSVRPITAIRFLFAGREVLAWAGPGLGPRRIPGETWQPYIATPPFGEHPSGHATFSAAAAAVLARFTGSDRFGASVIIPAGGSRVEPGITPGADVVLSWPTFTDAADQVGRSRRYGGIHFKAGDLVGRALGAMVGVRAWAAAEELFTGRRAGSGRGVVVGVVGQVAGGGGPAPLQPRPVPGQHAPDLLG
jgi:PAP2 superfamily